MWLSDDQMEETAELLRSTVHHGSNLLYNLKNIYLPFLGELKVNIEYYSSQTEDATKTTFKKN